jgi:arsenate reductase
MTVTIYHNPECGTSRNTLAMIRASGVEPTIIDYMQVGWSRPLLERLFSDLKMRPGEILRTTKSPAAELGLLGDDVTDEQILKAMLAHPVLVNRPIVETPKGVRLCRPSELVFDLLDTPPRSFTKEDGEVVHRH